MHTVCCFHFVSSPPSFQVASGLAYLHERKIVYYDLKSPNILVFDFPSPQESLQATQTTGYSQGEPYSRKSMKSQCVGCLFLFFLEEVIHLYRLLVFNLRGES